MSDEEKKPNRPPKWGLGILNDKETDEVPGMSAQGTDGKSLLTCLRLHLAYAKG